MHGCTLPSLGKVAGGSGGRTQFMHSRSLRTIDPLIPTMLGRSTSGFHRPGRHRVHYAGSAVRCLANRLKHELHSAKNHV